MAIPRPASDSIEMEPPTIVGIWMLNLHKINEEGYCTMKWEKKKKAKLKKRFISQKESGNGEGDEQPLLKQATTK